MRLYDDYEQYYLPPEASILIQDCMIEHIRYCGTVYTPLGVSAKNKTASEILDSQLKMEITHKNGRLTATMKISMVVTSAFNCNLEDNSKSISLILAMID